MSPVKCLEVWCDMHPLFYEAYLRQTDYGKKKLLGVLNPEKLRALAFLLDLHEKRGLMTEVRMKCRDKILVFCDSIYPLRVFADLFGYPVLTGSTSDSKRKHDLSDFRQRSDRNVVFLSKIGDTSIDLPEATVLIQVEGQEGSRRQEAQRLGRILRPKIGMGSDAQAFFYTLVSRDTKV